MNTLLAVGRAALIALGLALTVASTNITLAILGLLAFGSGAALVGWNARGDRDRERYARKLRTLLNGKTTPMHIKTNPECAQGKHDNCDGTGWDIDLDRTAQCPCSCHINLRPKGALPDTLNP